MKRLLSIVFIGVSLAFTLGLSARPEAQPENTAKFMVGTWEKVQAEPADPGKPNQERILKMITPSHFLVMSVDLWTHKITGAHGGPCSFGVGEYSEVIEYATAGGMNPDPAKKYAFKISKDGDRFVQSGRIGNTSFKETWKPAAPASKPAAAPGSPPQWQPENTAKFMVGTWEMVPAKPAGPGNPKQERNLKMITPNHFLVMFIDTWTHKITGAHGGPCSFGVGEYSEVIEYSLAGNPDPAKKWAFKIRKDGDRFIQSFGKIGDNDEQTWKPAAPASKPAATRAKLGLQRVTEDVAKLGPAASVGGIAALKSPLEWLRQARAAADGITDGTRKAAALVTVARFYAKAGDASTAQRALATACDTGGVDLTQTGTWGALGAIAGAQAKAGDTAGAQKTVQDALAAAEDIGDRRKKNEAFQTIASQLALSGYYAGAHIAIERCSEPWTRPFLYTVVEACQIRAGDIAGARQTVESAKQWAAGVTDPQQKTNAFIELAKLQTTMGDAAGARQSVEAAASDASGFSRANVAGVLAKLGDVAGAKANADTIQGGDQKDFERMSAYSQIAVVQFKAGDIAGANQSVAVAKAIAAKNPKEKASNYATLALWLTFRGGDKVASAAVRQTVGEALAAAATLADPDQRAGVYSIAARAQGDVHDLAGLRQTMDLLKPLVPSVPRAKDFEWFVFICHLADLGDPNAAKAVLAIAPPGAQWLENAGSVIAAGQAKMGDLAGAKATAMAISDQRDRAWAFFNIAEARARAGDLRAVRSWADSLTDAADRAAVCAGAAGGCLPEDKLPDLQD